MLPKVPSLLSIPWIYGSNTSYLFHFSDLNTSVMNAYLFKYGFAVAFPEIFPSAQYVCVGALELTQHEVILACLSCSDPSDNS